MRGSYIGLEVVRQIAEVGVGMVEAITQINAAHKPTSVTNVGAFIRLSLLRRADTVNQGQNKRKVLWSMVKWVMALPRLVQALNGSCKVP